MLLQDQHPNNKSIMAGVVGVPNAGKSSLINYLLGFDLTIVTPKPQTTRNQFHCALTVDRTEVVLVDTPGVHRSGQEINVRMIHQAREGMDGADVVLLILDLSRPIPPQLEEVQSVLKGEARPVWAVFNKSDLLENADHASLAMIFEKAKLEFPLLNLKRYFVLSALKGEGVHQLTGALCDTATPGAHLYPHGDVSNKSERFFVTEFIREQAFLLLEEELPYELAVIIDEFKDGRAKDGQHDTSYISASILVNRPSQRAIVVGSKGSMIREIGARARKKIEDMMEAPAHLNLHVKVTPRWFKNNYILEELGLNRAPGSARVWRKK